MAGVIMSDILERIERKEVMVVVGVRAGFAMTTSPNDSRELVRLAKLGQQMQWVSVKDRLPLPDAMVLCCSKDGVIHTGYHYDCWHTGRFPVFVTHWMPLPPSPREVN